MWKTVCKFEILSGEHGWWSSELKSSGTTSLVISARFKSVSDGTGVHYCLCNRQFARLQRHHDGWKVHTTPSRHFWDTLLQSNSKWASLFLQMFVLICFLFSTVNKLCDSEFCRTLHSLLICTFTQCPKLLRLCLLKLQSLVSEKPKNQLSVWWLRITAVKSKSYHLF